jgi:hypothetical protein
VNNQLISQDYGDTSQIDITYSNTDFPSVQFWDSGYATLTNVIFAGNSDGGSGSITFDARPGFEVSLTSFMAAGYGRDTSLEYELTTASGDVLKPEATINLSGIVLRFGPDSYYSALDNISFDVRAIDAVSAVPLPAAAPMLASALGLGGFIGWRRKRKQRQAAAVA